MAAVGAVGSLAGGAAALGSLGLGIYGATSGTSAGNQPSPILGAQGAANQAYAGAGNLGQYDLYSPNIGQYTGISQGLINNPYASLYQGGANQASQMGQQAGLGAFGAGQGLYGAGQQILNTAFDPQQVLYNRTLQQLQDQVNAQNAMSGVATSPYGAGLANQAYSNFNIDWQNQQLGRELSGLQGAQNAFGQGAGLQQGGVGEYLQGAALPYGTFNTIGQGQLGALSGLGQFGAAGQQVAQQPIQDYLSYMTGAQGGNIQIGQLGINQAQLGLNQAGATGQAIGGGLGGLGALGWGFSPQNPYSPTNYGNFQAVGNTPYSGLPPGTSLLNAGGQQ